MLTSEGRAVNCMLDVCSEFKSGLYTTKLLKI